MDPITVGSLISGGASILGGLFGQKSAKAANRANLAMAKQQMRLQEDFAKHGLTWRVQDAQAAGLHPLSALGAQLPSYSPIGFQQTGDSSMANALSDAGQSIGRGISSRATASERLVQGLNLQLLQKQLEESDVRKMLMQSEARRNDAEALAASRFPDPSAHVVEGQGDSVPGNGAGFQMVPTDIQLGGKNPGVTPGPAGPAFTTYTLTDGTKVLLPSKNASEPLESVGEIASTLLTLDANRDTLKEMGVRALDDFWNRFHGHGKRTREKFVRWLKEFSLKGGYGVP